MSTFDAFIQGLPKAELHVHHVGSASPEVVSELAERHAGTTLVPADPDKLADYFVFSDFAHFIEVYLSVVDLLRTPADIHALTYGVARDLAGQNVRYAELTMTPYTSVVRGIEPEAFCEAIEDARLLAERDFGIVLRWCFDIPGESGLAAAEATLSAALDQQPAGLLSFGLGGPEIGVPRPQYGPYFEQARAAGLHSVPHAGESTGPETIWDSIHYLGAERIGHGIAAVRDRTLMNYLRENEIPLEICPTSNVRTRSVASLEVHPLVKLVESGIRISINSDDPPMFSTSLNQEYAVAANMLGLEEQGIADIARWAVRDSFLSPADKAELIREIDVYATPAP